MICIVLFVFVIQLDLILRTNLFFNKKFWLFHLIIILLATLVDNYISGRPFVIFNPRYLINVRVYFVPIENYLFGFTLLTLNLILFEFTNRKHEK